MNEIMLFNSPQFGEVRTAGTPDNPFFCLADVCRALELDPSAVVRRLDDGVISSHPTLDALGRTQKANFVNEDGLYDVILDSRKPEARAFRKWITGEVIPSIRKTGGYIPGDTDEEIMAKALQIAQRTIDSKAQRIQILEGENGVLKEELQVMAPKAQYTDEVLQSTETYTFTEMAKALNFKSAQAFIKRLIEDKMAYRQSGQVMLMARYAGHGYTTTRTARFFRHDGSVGTSTSTVFTEKGRMFLHERYR